MDPVLTVFEKTGEEVARARLYDLYKVGAYGGDTDYYWPQCQMRCANDCTRFSTKGDKLLIGAAGKIVIWDFRRFSFCSPVSSLSDYNQHAADPFDALPPHSRRYPQSNIISLQTSPNDEFLCCVTWAPAYNHRGFEERTRLYSLTAGATIYTDHDFDERVFPQPSTSNYTGFPGRFNFANRSPLRVVGSCPDIDPSLFEYNPVCEIKRVTELDDDASDDSDDEQHGPLGTVRDTKLLTGFHCDPKPGSWQFSDCGNLMTVLDKEHRTVALSSVTEHCLHDASFQDNCRLQALHHLRFEGTVACAYFLPFDNPSPHTRPRSDDDPPVLVALMRPQEGPDCALYECGKRPQEGPDCALYECGKRVSLHWLTVGELLGDVLPRNRLCFAPAPDPTPCRAIQVDWLQPLSADICGVLYLRCALSDQLWNRKPRKEGLPFAPVLEHKCFRTRTSQHSQMPTALCCKPF
jgi:hypothetical protein